MKISILAFLIVIWAMNQPDIWKMRVQLFWMNIQLRWTRFWNHYYQAKIMLYKHETIQLREKLNEGNR